MLLVRSFVYDVEVDVHRVFALFLLRCVVVQVVCVVAAVWLTALFCCFVAVVAFVAVAYPILFVCVLRVLVSVSTFVGVVGIMSL